ncbi:MAG: hypothetical protein GWM98_07170 [Nitrospinaceae bacterium]|nr:hypothetical protein [Nitrospinaceae bacterium]NIR54317.1 hypothetical protein [Nitrospinaceae bacterium]NIS84735.1 hypothetical protein [Nitrospinaceae bacterium]NIT81536.1 hypothetical protein [Nitrospinaceae bacterium]NIU43821.1 hypothetical protein [Nitrospinaceae bacterium]
MKSGKFKRLIQIDWDAIAGIIAAVAAIVMHYLHALEVDVLLMITLVLLALLFIRDLRSEGRVEKAAETLQRIEHNTHELQKSIHPVDAHLIGPMHLRQETERFVKRARGEMIWFHVCPLMFKTQLLFDTLLKPAIENPQVTSLRFTLDESQKPLWESEVLPKIEQCANARKVQSPDWVAIKDNVSFILSETGNAKERECLLSFWGEPFMSQNIVQSVPRYIFHVQSHSELVTRFVEIERQYRLNRA